MTRQGGDGEYNLVLSLISLTEKKCSQLSSIPSLNEDLVG